MSIQLPNTQVSQHVLSALPPHQTPSPALKRACKRYVTAMNELNKQICDYNTEALQRQVSVCRTHAEMQQLLLQATQVQFAAVNVHAVAAHIPRLIVLDRAAQCVNLLREVLDEWEGDAGVSSAPPPAAGTTDAENAFPQTFSLFSAWSPVQGPSMV